MVGMSIEKALRNTVNIMITPSFDIHSFRFVTGLAAMLGLVPMWLCADPACHWEADGNRSLELRGADGPLVRFALDCAPRDPHFEVLATSDGRNTVWVAPPDHIWHYGMWFSWKFINGVNFWEIDEATGLQQGRSEILDPHIESTPDGSTATIIYRDLAHPVPDGPAVLEDLVLIRITKPQDGHGPQVVWQVTTKALSDVTLDRTPPPNEPDGKAWGGYAGFSWRGAKDFTDLHYLDSEGSKDMACHRQRARWVNADGTLAGKPAGITLIDHPLNPEYPSSWYTAASPLGPGRGTFWYLSPALLQPKPLVLKKGESFTHIYQATVHDGHRKPIDIEKEAKTFSAHKPTDP